jgi:hypothetical protein
MDFQVHCILVLLKTLTLILQGRGAVLRGSSLPFSSIESSNSTADENVFSIADVLKVSKDSQISVNSQDLEQVVLSTPNNESIRCTDKVCEVTAAEMWIVKNKTQTHPNSKEKQQLAFYLTVYYLAVMVGASLFAFYCICQSRANSLRRPSLI